MDSLQDHHEHKVATPAVPVGIDTMTKDTATEVIEKQLHKSVKGAVHQKISSAQRTLLGKIVIFFTGWRD